MSECKKVKAGAVERMRKYRAENKARSDLSVLKQQLKRSQLMASGTPEGDKMKKNAAERKRLQRMRSKARANEERSVLEGEAKMPGELSSFSSQELI